MKKHLLALLLCSISTSALASYEPGTYITPNAQNPEKKLLVLEHSVVDLYRGIEILNFNHTLNKSLCDVYKGLTGEYLPNKTSCTSAHTVYTEPTLSAQDGWRLGHSSSIVNIVEYFGGAYQAASWLTIDYTNRRAMTFFENSLGSTRTAGGLSSFIVWTANGIDTNHNYASSLDELNYSGGETGYRVSQGGSYSSAVPDTAVLLVRDWLGVERPISSRINDVPTPTGILSILGIGALLTRKLRRKHTGA